MRSEKEIRKILKYWEGILAGIEVGQNVDVAEVFVHLPKEAQNIALELLTADPQIRHLTNRWMDGLVKPLIKEFIDTLEWILDENP